MSSTRVYVVREVGNNTERLIRATYRATAVRHAAQDKFSARKATHDDLERLITAGVRVEQAAEPQHDADEPGEQLP